MPRKPATPKATDLTEPITIGDGSTSPWRTAEPEAQVDELLAAGVAASSCTERSATYAAKVAKLEDELRVAKTNLADAEKQRLAAVTALLAAAAAAA